MVPLWALGTSGFAHPVGGLKPRLPHQATHPLLAGADAREAQPRPHLAVALAMEGRVLQDLPDVAEEFRIGARAHRAALIGRGAFMNGDRLSPPLRVDRGARQAPKGAHPLQAVGSARGGEAGLTHRLHLLPAKGRPASRRSIFSRRTSPSIVSSPTLALSRAFSSSRSSAGRALSAASPPRRNASRQAESRAAVVPNSRQSVSRLSPRKRRRTASRLRWQENRPRSLRCPGRLGSVRPTGALRQSPLLLLFVHRDTPFSMNHGSIECPTKP